jgi:hypothetical protein
MSTTTKAQIGSVSHGTMREEDLIPRFIDLLEEFGHEDEELSEIRHRAEQANYYDSEEAAYDLNDYLFYALQEYAPPFCYFGSHPGDGSDYGFWPSGELLHGTWHSDEVLKTDETNINPDQLDGQSYVLHVNDHGNATLYRVKIELEEVWAIV